MVGFEDMPVLLVERPAEQWRMGKLEADQLGALVGHDQEGHDGSGGGNARGALQQRLSQQRGPLDLEQERGLAAQVPDAIERLEGGYVAGGNERQVSALLLVAEQIAHSPAQVSAAALL